MIIDPAQPWGVAIDYAGRATVTEDGHTLDIRVYDNTFGGALEPDPATGGYPSVYVTAQFSEEGEAGSVLRGSGQMALHAEGTDPVVPDPTAIERAVGAALADFEARRLAYITLCMAWAPATPAPAPAGSA